MPSVEAIAFKVRVPTLVLFFCINALGFDPTARSIVIFPPVESNVGVGDLLGSNPGKLFVFIAKPLPDFVNFVGSYEITK